jgi:hypothetical protein
MPGGFKVKPETPIAHKYSPTEKNRLFEREKIQIGSPRLPHGVSVRTITRGVNN